MAWRWRDLLWDFTYLCWNLTITEQKKRVAVCFIPVPNFRVMTTAKPTDIAATKQLERSRLSVRIQSDFDIVLYFGVIRLTPRCYFMNVTYSWKTSLASWDSPRIEDARLRARLICSAAFGDMINHRRLNIYQATAGFGVQGLTGSSLACLQ